MQVRQLNDWLIHVKTEEGEDVSSVYRMSRVTEIVRFNPDGTIYTQLRVTRNPVICKFLDLNFMRVTFRRCHIWFTKKEYNGKVSIGCIEYPIPVDELQFSKEQETYKFFLK